MRNNLLVQGHRQGLLVLKDAELSYERIERFQGTAGRMLGSRARLVPGSTGTNLN